MPQNTSNPKTYDCRVKILMQQAYIQNFNWIGSIASEIFQIEYYFFWFLNKNQEIIVKFWVLFKNHGSKKSCISCMFGATIAILG